MDAALTTEKNEKGSFYLRKKDWLNLAKETLIEEGIANVKIKRMAEKLEVSRSSFYWFFKNIDELYNELMLYWEATNSKPFIERAERSAPTVHIAIMNLFECWVDPRLFDPRLDVAVRLWARTDDSILACVKKVDLERMNALTSMFSRYGYDSKESVVRSRTLYMTQIGQYTLDFDEPERERFNLLEKWLKVFSGSDPKPDDVRAFRKRFLGSE